MLSNNEYSNYCFILNLQEGASKEEIEVSYRELSGQYFDSNGKMHNFYSVEEYNTLCEAYRKLMIYSDTMNCKHEGGDENAVKFVNGDRIDKNKWPLTITNNKAASCSLPETSLSETKPVWLWKATKSGCADVYILGALHIVRFNQEKYFGPAIRCTLDKVSRVFTEVDISEKNRINPKGIDDWVAALAHTHGKELISLEDNEKRLFLGVSSDLLNGHIGLVLTEQKLKEASEKYLSGETVSEEINYKEDMTALIKRNEFWLTAIRKASEEQKTCLVVVGAAHNVGKFGVPSLLKMAGYEVIPLMCKIPLTQKKILRGMIHESTIFNPLRFFHNPVSEREKSAGTSGCMDLVPYVPKPLY